MNLGGISPGSLLLIFLIILLVFGTSRLRSIGEDLGHALKSFKKGLKSDDDKKKELDNKEENKTE